MRQPIDCSTEYGAQLLADRITTYWRNRGVTVKCEAVNVGLTIHDKRDAQYGVRSDIGMYEPRGAR